MLIVCPTCSSSYLIRATEIGAEGRLVRCGACQNSWQVGAGPSQDEDASQYFSQDVEKTTKIDHLPTMNGVQPGRHPTRRLALGGLAIAAAASLIVLPFGRIADVARSIIGRVIPADRFADIDFENVSSQLVAENEQIFLIVEGQIVAKSGEGRVLPGLALSIRGESKDQIFRWTAKPPAETISAGAPIPFKVRLASPPITGREVMIRFVDASEVEELSAS